MHEKPRSSAQPGWSDRILNLRHLATLHFREEHWIDLGTQTGCADLIQQHSHLGQLHWGDDNYDACVLQVLTAVVERSPESLSVMEIYARQLCDCLESDSLAGATLTHV